MNLNRKIIQLRRMPVRHWFYLRQAMRLRASAVDPESGDKYRFVADSLPAYQRARALFSKEPGTIAWLRDNLRPDDVFVDIGANVGTFSLFAARQIAGRGHVFAFEPHLPTTVQLMQNIALNRLGGEITVLSVAVSGEDRFTPFLYKRWREGDSGSQLEIEGGPGLKNAVGRELKSGLTLDTLIEREIIPPPNLIKVDTDGVELQITSGMKRFLQSERRPRSVMIEVQRGEFAQQSSFMKGCSYEMVQHHLFRKSEKEFAKGKPLEELAFNAIFEPVK